MTTLVGESVTGTRSEDPEPLILSQLPPHLAFAQRLRIPRVLRFATGKWRPRLGLQPSCPTSIKKKEQVPDRSTYKLGVALRATYSITTCLAKSIHKS